MVCIRNPWPSGWINRRRNSGSWRTCCINHSLPWTGYCVRKSRMKLHPLACWVVLSYKPSYGMTGGALFAQNINSCTNCSRIRLAKLCINPWKSPMVKWICLYNNSSPDFYPIWPLLGVFINTVRPYVRKSIYYWTGPLVPRTMNKSTKYLTYLGNVRVGF